MTKIAFYVATSKTFCSFSHLCYSSCRMAASVILFTLLLCLQKLPPIHMIEKSGGTSFAGDAAVMKC